MVSLGNLSEAGHRLFSIKILIAIIVFGSGAYLLADSIQSKWTMGISSETTQTKKFKSFNGTTSDYVSQNKLVDMEQIRNTDLVFVGGHPRSGTTLMRAILDVHPRIRCGTENIIIKYILKILIAEMPFDVKNIVGRMAYNGVRNETFDDSMALFMYNVIVNHGPPSPRLCAKDPEILYYMSYVHKLFPNAKFVNMIRDGRAVAYSNVVNMKEAINVENFRKRLTNTSNNLMNQQCLEIGSALCMQVKYEDLVTDTNKTMRAVINFLGESWNADLLRHQDFIGSEIKVIEQDWSTTKVIQPVYQDAIDCWIDKIPYLSQEEILKIAPMLHFFGYSLQVNETIVHAQKKVAELNSFNSTQSYPATNGTTV